MYGVSGEDQEHERIRPTLAQLLDGLLCIVNLDWDDINLPSARDERDAVANEMIDENAGI